MAKPPIDWEKLLVDGYEPLKRAQRIYRHLPHDPRCKLCLSPFAGIGGKLCALAGRKPSRKNPNLCTACFNDLPSGGIELDIAVVFADVRGSTALGEQSSATAFADRLNRFYATATDVFIRHDGLVDKLIGDEVMALFLPGVTGAEYRRVAADAALALAEAIKDVPTRCRGQRRHCLRRQCRLGHGGRLHRARRRGKCRRAAAGARRARERLCSRPSSTSSWLPSIPARGPSSSRCAAATSRLPPRC